MTRLRLGTLMVAATGNRPSLPTAVALAILAGPSFWLFFWSWLRPELHLSWPLHAPGRFLLAALVYPVLEEMVFRGGVQGALLGWPWGRRSCVGITGANLATTLSFALFHLFAHTPGWALAVILPSLVFGYFRDRTGRLGTSIGLHIWYNAGYFWLFG